MNHSMRCRSRYVPFLVMVARKCIIPGQSLRTLHLGPNLENIVCVWISASPLSLISVVFPASCSVRNFADAYLDSSSRYPEKVLTQTLKKTKFWLFLIHSQRQTLLSQPSATPGSILNFIHNFTICLCVQNKGEKAAFTLLIVFEEDFLDWMKSGDELSFCFYTKLDFGAETERHKKSSLLCDIWTALAIIILTVVKATKLARFVSIQCLEIQGRPKSFRSSTSKSYALWFKILTSTRL